jgi:ferredoxin-type protein NapF
MTSSHKDIDPGRRGFLTGSWLTQAGRKPRVQAMGRLGPEPPIIASHVSHALCTGCGGRCLSVCETGVIRLHPKEHGLADMPWLDFSAAGCTFCGKCADACPQVEVPSADAEHPAIGIAEIDLARCLAYTGVFCISCQSSCASQAIQRDRLSRPQMLTDVCTGCGACVSVCPVQAIKVSQHKFYVLDPTQPAN